MTRPTGARRLPLSTDTHGDIVLGNPVAPGPLTASLLVDGGVLTVDMLDPIGKPALIVGDVRATRRWLGAALGEEASAAALFAADTDGGDRTVPVAPTALWDNVARLAVAHWVEQWHPGTTSMPFPDGDLLDLEIGHLTYLADRALSETASETATTRMGPHLDRLIEEVRSGLEYPPVDTVEDGVQDILHTILYTALGVVDAASSQHTQLVELIETLELRDSAEREFADQVEQAFTGRPLLVHSLSQTSIDWAQVPHRVFSTADGTVTWDALDAGVVRVEVTGVLDPVVAQAMRVRLYTPGRPVPVAGAELAIDQDDDTVAYAEIPVPPTAVTTELMIDVYDPTLGHPVRLGTAARFAAAERQAVRVVAGLRARAHPPAQVGGEIDRTAANLERLPAWSGSGTDTDLATRLRLLGDHLVMDPTLPWPATAAELRLR